MVQPPCLELFRRFYQGRGGGDDGRFLLFLTQAPPVPLLEFTPFAA
jgi:hypothetical protein